MYIQLYKLTRRLYINWKSRLKEHLLLGKARQMIVMLKDTLNNSLLLIQNSIQMNQFGIKRWGTFTRFNVERTLMINWLLSSAWRRRRKKLCYATNRKNQSKFVASNILKSTEEKEEMKWIELFGSYFVTMLYAQRMIK